MKSRWILMVVCALILAACSGGETSTVSGSEFRIPLSAISDGEAHYYEADAGGTTVRFFVLQSADGTYRAAFDACDVCYEARQGYSQDGEFMVCNNCGMRFHSSRINEVKGGCNPAPLERSVIGEELLVSLDDIAKGASYF